MSKKQKSACKQSFFVFHSFGNWFYVTGGMINWDYTGLTCYSGAWFYVSGGTINWTTAIVDYNGAKFYVQNGMVDWDYTGTVNYNGSTYNVINGMTY